MAGKGSKPRSCFSKDFKDNFDTINWSKKPDDKSIDTKIGNKVKISDEQQRTNNYQSFYSR
jgi:hypothetical protein